MGDGIIEVLIVLGAIVVIVLMGLAAINWFYAKVNIHG